jgi:hypothetical protein
MLTHVKLVNASVLTTLVEGQTGLRKSVEAQRLYLDMMVVVMLLLNSGSTFFFDLVP